MEKKVINDMKSELERCKLLSILIKNRFDEVWNEEWVNDDIGVLYLGNT